MKTLLLSLIFLSSVTGYSQSNDKRTTIEIANKIIDVASNKNTDELNGLCDPKGEGNDICSDETKESEKKALEMFLTMLEGAKVLGDPSYYKDSDGNDMAKLPIQMNFMGQQMDKKMKFIKRDGVWYFYKF